MPVKLTHGDREKNVDGDGSGSGGNTGRRPGGRRKTIYDLARLAGASPTAVSAVLSGSWRKRRISEALAERILRIAEEEGYSRNMQASALRRERSHLIGMLVPKYDNRYFGAIAEGFEAMARARALFPIITCTRRDPRLELEAARAMIAHQVDCLVACGATDPDRITRICEASGVRSLNLDLPGRLAPSVISDNRGGAQALTAAILRGLRAAGRPLAPLLFVGGRAHDHNTAERIAGFRAAHADAGLAAPPELILAAGYAPEKAEAALAALVAGGRDLPPGVFVNSTITLEGVVRWLKANDAYDARAAHLGCFDWDPLATVLSPDLLMVRQDVPAMLAALFALVDEGTTAARTIELPTRFAGGDGEALQRGADPPESRVMPPGIRSSSS